MLVLLTFLAVVIILVYMIPARVISPPPSPPIPPEPPIPPPPPPPVVIPPIIQYNGEWEFTFTNENLEPETMYIEVRGIGGGLAFTHSLLVDVTAGFDFSSYLSRDTQYILYANFTDSATSTYEFTTPI